MPQRYVTLRRIFTHHFSQRWLVSSKQVKENRRRMPLANYHPFWELNIYILKKKSTSDRTSRYGFVQDKFNLRAGFTLTFQHSPLFVLSSFQLCNNLLTPSYYSLPIYL
ncbi:hypothetical protein V3C99_008190 [Haemonchus contortus]|uniref:Uncharacterized protein n=1 Tax=Haemonchus contortus TaxID=6289 RepID=A0A7I4YL98_HAECO